MNGSFLALTVTPHEVKLVEFDQQNGVSVPRRFRHYRFGEEGDKDASGKIKEWLGENPPASLKTFLVINTCDIDYREFSFPFDSTKKVSRAIQFEISSEYPPEEYVVDYIECYSREPGQKTFLTAIVKKQVLREKIQEAEEAGLRVVGITSDLSSLGNYFRDEEEALVMETGEKKTLFALYLRGVPALVRDIPLGVTDLEKGQDSNQKTPKGRKVLAAEIKRTVHSFSSKSGLKLERLFLTGNLFRVRPVLDRLSKDLDLDFITHRPGHLKFDEDDSDQLNTFASLLGILRWKKRGRVFNFFKDEFFREDPGAIRKGYLGWGTFIALFLVLSVFLPLGLKIIVLEKRKAFLSAETRRTFSSAFPNVKKIVDEAAQARNRLDAARSRVGENSQPGEISLLDALDAISRAIPPGTPFQIKSLFWEQGKIEMSGKTDSFKNVNLIRESLSGARLFSDVLISNAKSRNEGQDVEFNITLHLAG
ncbi:MAG: PilN domain-containing protein [Deltaproteobacteria bacterium]|nr:PilN domain-containing protein [Deltaproteobacteria bacterium]